MFKHNCFLIGRLHRSLSYYRKNSEISSISSSIDLNSKLKQLFQDEKYQEIIELVDQRFQICNSFSVVTAINACMKLQDNKRGISIQNRLASHIMNDSYVQTCLIRFYMQCHDVETASRLFTSIANKSNYAYTAMFKGLSSHGMHEKVLDLLEQMKIEPDNFTLTLSFNACGDIGSERAMKVGRKLIKKIKNDRRSLDATLNAVTHMLLKFGDIDNAKYYFKLMSVKTLMTYGTIIKKYIDHGMAEKALDLFEETNLKPNNIIYTLICGACTQLDNHRARSIGKKLVDQIISSGECDDITLNTIINMVGKFGDVNNAERIFHLIKNKTIVTYGAMMKVYNANRMAERTLDLYEQMHLEPNDIVRTLVLSGCAQFKNDRARMIGRKLLDDIIDKNCHNDFTLNIAINMCQRFADIKTADRIFSLIRNKTIGTFCTMMKLYAENGMAERTLDLFEQMSSEQNDIMRTIVLSACAQLRNDRARMIGRKIIDEIVDKKNCDDYTLNTAITTCGKFGDLKKAESLFQMVQNQSTVTYGAMMKVYNENEMAARTLDLFEQMPLQADSIIRTIVLSACSTLADDRAKIIGRKLIEDIVDKHRHDDFNLHAAINMCGKFGDIKKVESLFQIVQNPSVVTYGAIMKACTDNGMFERALDLFEQMKLTPNNIIHTIILGACAQLDNDRARIIGRKILDQIIEHHLQDSSLLVTAIHMLMRHGDIKNAEYVFSSIRVKNATTYGVLMNGYNFNSEPEKCLDAFEEMKKQNIPINQVISIALIGACAQLSIIQHCQDKVDLIPEDIRDNIQVKSAMIDMWARCGSIDKARHLFQSVLDPDTVTYNIMINGFGLNGMGLEAFELYTQMPANLRDEVTHICMLNACSHSGLYSQAKTIFNEISQKTEKTTTAMVDCLSRLFLFDEAQSIINSYEQDYSPSFVMYMSLLSGLRNNRNRTISEKVLQRMKSLFPDNKEGLLSSSILVSNVYSSLGEHEKAIELRSQYKKELRLNVKQGLSWTYVNGKIEKFHAHDHSHPLSSEIENEMQRMTMELKQHGYQFDSTWVTRSLEEGETMASVLCGHSEKLAIAFNFIQRPIPEFIQVTQNLRVCGDCHEFTKLIAKIRQRDIIVRDTNRIHHFQQNGQCSCQDHF